MIKSQGRFHTNGSETWENRAKPIRPYFATLFKIMFQEMLLQVEYSWVAKCPRDASQRITCPRGGVPCTVAYNSGQIYGNKYSNSQLFTIHCETKVHLQQVQYISVPRLRLSSQLPGRFENPAGPPRVERPAANSNFQLESVEQKSLQPMACTAPGRLRRNKWNQLGSKPITSEKCSNHLISSKSNSNIEQHCEIVLLIVLLMDIINSHINNGIFWPLMDHDAWWSGPERSAAAGLPRKVVLCHHLEPQGHLSEVWVVDGCWRKNWNWLGTREST